MKKITQTILIIFFILMCLFTPVYATQNETTQNGTSQTQTSQETLEPKSTDQILEMKKSELASMDYYKKKYGSETYGITAYILDRARIFSVPLVFIGVVFSAIYQYVIGIKKLDVRDKGFNSMIAIITIGVICQILPIVFTIVVTNVGN